jgi:hypothetical protein
MRNFDTPMMAAGVVTAGGGAGTKCNLTLNPITRVLTGSAGKETTVQIKNLSGGGALFQTISYNGEQIATETDSATFTIVGGLTKLTFVYEGSAAGDQIAIVDPCGNILDAFPSDPGNFSITRTVSA